MSNTIKGVNKAEYFKNYYATHKDKYIERNANKTFNKADRQKNIIKKLLYILNNFEDIDDIFDKRRLRHYNISKNEEGIYICSDEYLTNN